MRHVIVPNMRRAVEKQFGSLKSLCLEGAPHGPCVVLFHGYGADASDLLPLAEMMHLSADVTWVFPEAPMEVIIAPGFYGKAWYAIDMKRLEQAMVSGEPADLTQLAPPGMEEARKRAASLYEALRAQHSHVVIGGFSQGAMLSAELALTHAKKPTGLILMSASLLNEKRWRDLAPSCEGLTYFQSHGKNDALLGFQYAERLHEMLQESGLHGEFVGFAGGHEIPPKVIEKISYYLKSVLKNRH